MAEVIVTLRIMPESPDTDLKAIEKKAKEKISSYGGDVAKTEEIPVAFGLKSLNISFFMDESKGDTEPLEKEIAQIEEVNSVEVIDVRRAVG